MSKLTLDQRIKRTEESITKEELFIEESKEKIKKLKSELKTLKAEKEQSFAAEILKLIKSKGISQENFLSQLKADETESSLTDSSPTVVSDTANVESSSNFSTLK